jgi:hypothetical protein
MKVMMTGYYKGNKLPYEVGERDELIDEIWIGREWGEVSKEPVF